ncbi:MAG: orotidine-5'-phosphate decarboxylase [Gemmatimonadota bacterium]
MRDAPEVIVALDYPDPQLAWDLVTSLPERTWFKIGLELFTRAGPSVVERLVGDGRHVFLDLKLHDIPNTVAGAVRAAGRLGVRLLTVHGSGGEAMLRAAAESAATSNAEGDGDLRLLAITVLTSMDDAALASVMGPLARVEETAGRLAGLARESGIDGAVCSVNEARAVKVACGDQFVVVTPGIRLAGEGMDDQRRVATPAVARAAGADFLVVGRSITRADDPAGALVAIQQAVAGGV